MPLISWRKHPSAFRFTVDCCWLLEVRAAQTGGSPGVSHAITRRRGHAAYSRCMRSLVDEMWSIPLTFYKEKMLIRHVLTAGAVGCENPLSFRISSHSECLLLFIYFCTLIWGALWNVAFHWKMREAWEKRSFREREKRDERGHRGLALGFLCVCCLRWATWLLNTQITNTGSVLQDVYYEAASELCQILHNPD